MKLEKGFWFLDEIAQLKTQIGVYSFQPFLDRWQIYYILARKKEKVDHIIIYCERFNKTHLNTLTITQINSSGIRVNFNKPSF